MHAWFGLLEVLVFMHGLNFVLGLDLCVHCNPIGRLYSFGPNSIVDDERTAATGCVDADVAMLSSFRARPWHIRCRPDELEPARGHSAMRRERGWEPGSQLRRQEIEAPGGGAVTASRGTSGSVTAAAMRTP